MEVNIEGLDGGDVPDGDSKNLLRGKRFHWQNKKAISFDENNKEHVSDKFQGLFP